MARTVDQIGPEVIGGMLYQLLVQIASLRAEIERLQEELIKAKAPPPEEGVE